MSTVPVVIVGAGPTGLTAATLLAQYGVECLIIERWESIYPAPWTTAARQGGRHRADPRD